jgi:hypothetical protein
MVSLVDLSSNKPEIFKELLRKKSKNMNILSKLTWTERSEAIFENHLTSALRIPDNVYTANMI